MMYLSIATISACQRDCFSPEGMHELEFLTLSVESKPANTKTTVLSDQLALILQVGSRHQCNSRFILCKGRPILYCPAHTFFYSSSYSL